MGFLVKIPVLDGRMQQTVRNLIFSCADVVLHANIIYCFRNLCDSYLANPKPVYDIIHLSLHAPVLYLEYLV